MSPWRCDASNRGEHVHKAALALVATQEDTIVEACHINPKVSCPRAALRHGFCARRTWNLESGQGFVNVVLGVLQRVFRTSCVVGCCFALEPE